MKSRLAIFASGGGSNAEAIMKYFQRHSTIEVAAVASNKADAFVLERAKKFSVPSRVFDKDEFKKSDAVLRWLEEQRITHIVLAGFLVLVPERIIEAFRDRIINIHPSLLPKFGGKGMYGMHVHEAVVAAHERKTGLTVHLVNGQYDQGKILAQVSCVVMPQDDAHTVAERVLKLEHETYPREIEKWAKP